MVAYNFNSDLARIQKVFPDAVILSKSGEELEAWNRDEIKMLLVHPASASHGINAQYGGSAIIWFGLNWNLEYYQQMNKRMHRQGREKPVRVIHIVAKDTIDERVFLAVENKAKTQQELLNFIKKGI
jgi:SNF2 family DNA or RNA helicase